MQDSKLVLSELVSKSEEGNTGLGLVNPFEPDGSELYVVVDKISELRMQRGIWISSDLSMRTERSMFHG